MPTYRLPFGHAEWPDSDAPHPPAPLDRRRRRPARADYDERVVRLAADPMRFVRDLR